MDIRRDALGQAQKAFAEDSGKVYTAMHVILETVKYACRNGMMTLSKDGYAGNGKPYVLDVLEEKETAEIPLKQYLAFGLECALMGGGMEEETGKLLENKYYACAYTGTDAVIAYVYWIGIREMLRKSNYLSILEYFLSLIPDEREDLFEKYVKKLDAGYSELSWGPVLLRPENEK